MMGASFFAPIIHKVPLPFGKKLFGKPPSFQEESYEIRGNKSREMLTKNIPFITLYYTNGFLFVLRGEIIWLCWCQSREFFCGSTR